MHFAALLATAFPAVVLATKHCNKKPWETYKVTDLVVGDGAPAATFQFTAPGINVTGLGQTPDVDVSCTIHFASNNWNNCDKNVANPHYRVWANASPDGNDGIRIQIQPKFKMAGGQYNGQAAAIFTAPIDNSVTEFEGDTYYFYCG